MRRAEFLLLTGLTVGHYKNLKQSGALPFNDDQHGWREYSEFDALATRVSLALSDQGVARSEAATYTTLGRVDIARGMKRSPSDAGALMFGVVDYMPGRMGYPFGADEVFPCQAIGRLHDLSNAVLEMHNLQRFTLKEIPHRAIVKATFVNVDILAESVEDAAKPLGIDIDWGRDL